jgi:hypothetical protein
LGDKSNADPQHDLIYLHGFSIDAGREAHDCDQGVHHAKGEETVLQNPAHYSHQLECDVLFYTDHILYPIQHIPYSPLPTTLYDKTELAGS